MHIKRFKIVEIVAGTEISIKRNGKEKHFKTYDGACDYKERLEENEGDRTFKVRVLDFFI